MIATRPTRAEYDAAFALEVSNAYPVVTGFEASCGFALDTARLEAAARVLACPVKANPPCWQHGRVLYAVARRYLSTLEALVCASCAYEYGHSTNCAMPTAPKVRAVPQDVCFMDIGTAKGFSALMLNMARLDADVTGHVESVDVIDPLSREYRNSVIEVDGPKRLTDYLNSWPEAAGIRFYQSTGIDWILRSHARVHVAFIDGKHTGDVVSREAKLLSHRQEQGDVVVFDDVHLPDVADAVQGMAGAYELERIQVLPKRAYAIGVRR